MLRQWQWQCEKAQKQSKRTGKRLVTDNGSEADGAVTDLLVADISGFSMEGGQVDAAREIAKLISDGKTKDVLVVTGAGVEREELVPNSVHALCSLISAHGGAHVTTNFSGVQLLAQPDGQHDDVQFVAVHSTIYDQEAGRQGRGGRRRPRCLLHATTHPVLQASGRVVPIPTQDVRDDDPNMVDARLAAKKRTTLLILGSSLIKSTNGKALNFLDSAQDVSRVIYVNPDPSRSHACVLSDLSGWGLPKLQNKGPLTKKQRLVVPLSTADPLTATVECVMIGACEFAEAVLGSPGMEKIRGDCARWIAPDKVCRFRALFPLPPEEDLGAVGKHRFGLQGVSIKEIYARVATLNAETRGHIPASKSGTDDTGGV